MNKPEPVVMSAYQQPYDKNYINYLRNLAKQNVAKITEKPTLKSMFESVDKCWDNPVFVRQTNFKNKDQHYAYVSEYYHSVIEQMTLEEYKKMVLQDIMNRLEKAENLLDSEKIVAAAKIHKQQEADRLKQYNDQVETLKEKNEKVTNESLKKFTERHND